MDPHNTFNKKSLNILLICLEDYRTPSITCRAVSGNVFKKSLISFLNRFWWLVLVALLVRSINDDILLWYMLWGCVSWDYGVCISFCTCSMIIRKFCDNTFFSVAFSTLVFQDLQLEVSFNFLLFETFFVSWHICKPSGLTNLKKAILLICKTYRRSMILRIFRICILIIIWYMNR